MEEVNNLKSVNNPAAEYLFTVNHNAKNMDAQKADVFHTTISKVLFLYKREISDIQPTVSFLCTIAKGPEENKQENY